MTPADAPTVFVIDDDAAVRAEQALVHRKCDRNATVVK